MPSTLILPTSSWASEHGTSSSPLERDGRNQMRTLPQFVTTLKKFICISASFIFPWTLSSCTSGQPPTPLSPKGPCSMEALPLPCAHTLSPSLSPPLPLSPPCSWHLRTHHMLKSVIVTFSALTALFPPSPFTFQPHQSTLVASQLCTQASFSSLFYVHNI